MFLVRSRRKRQTRKRTIIQAADIRNPRTGGRVIVQPLSALERVNQ